MPPLVVGRPPPAGALLQFHPMKKRDAHLVETFVSKKTIWRGRAVNFDVDTVRLPDGKLATREYAQEHLQKGKALFVWIRQYTQSKK